MHWEYHANPSLAALSLSPSLSVGAEELAPRGAASHRFSSFFFFFFFFFALLATDKISSCYFTACGSSSFIRLTYCRFSPTLLISLCFLSLFCFSILSAPHLAFLGSHSHYATLAGTRPYISEYPGFMFSLLTRLCAPHTVVPQLFLPFTAHFYGVVAFI